MPYTSFFIGLNLRGIHFVKLFLDLEEYIEDNALNDSIELQNKLSLHMTIYYLNTDFVNKNFNKIYEYIANLNRTKLVVKVDGYDYFYREDKQYLLYFSLQNTEAISSINTKAKELFKLDSVVDNQYDFIPHISILKVKNPKTYLTHKDNIEKIVKKNISKLKNKDFEDRFYLFGANSKISPELQEPIEKKHLLSLF